MNNAVGIWPVRSSVVVDEAGVWLGMTEEAAAAAVATAAATAATTRATEADCARVRSRVNGIGRSRETGATRIGAPNSCVVISIGLPARWKSIQSMLSGVMGATASSLSKRELIRHGGSPPKVESGVVLSRIERSHKPAAPMK